MEKHYPMFGYPVNPYFGFILSADQIPSEMQEQPNRNNCQTGDDYDKHFNTAGAHGIRPPFHTTLPMM